MTFARRPGPVGRFNRRGLASGGGWRPTMLSGCVLWLRADMGITKDGSDRVSAWADQSGNGNDLLQGTGSLQPTWRANGGPNNGPYVDHGTDDWMLDAFTLAQPEHVFLVARKKVPTQHNPTVIDGGGGTGNRMRLYFIGVAPGSDVTISMTSDGANIISQTGTFTNWNRIEAQFNGASGKLRVNDGSYATGNVGTNGGSGVILSRFGTSSGECAADFAEVAIFSRILSSAETAQYQADLAARHGV